MNKNILCFALFIFAINSWGQGNCFKNYDEFQSNSPSLAFNFHLKKRTMKDVFMTGGIQNYRVRKVIPSSGTEKVEKEVWGIVVDDTVYINSYPYSKLKGFNRVLGIGYYSYFIGEPARTRDKQISLGIIEPNQEQMAVCCQTGYVILRDGTVKHLRPKLLLELCKDNERIANEIEAANLKIEEVDKMFGFLNRYNAAK